MDFRIKTRKPHDKQEAIISHPSKRKVIVTGRRFGKTTAAAIKSVDTVLKGGRVLFAGPTEDQILMYWSEVKRTFQEAIDANVVYKNEQRHILELPNGGRIRAKTAWNADTLRGDYADELFLEEYAMMDPDAWEVVGAPMLLDNNGSVWFMSSPKRRNHFHRLFARCASNDRWDAWHATSHDNPHLSKDALADMAEDMTDEAYRQEILAEFLENEGSVFRNLDAVLIAPATTAGEHKGHRLVAGIDWGQHDYTVCSVGCRTCRTEVALYRSNNRDYIYQRKHIGDLLGHWGVEKALAESNAMGQPIIEEMQAEGLPVEGRATTSQSKQEMIEGLALACEKESFQFLADPIGRTEMEAYEAVYGAHGRPKYGAPYGVNDDIVIGRALMRQAADTSGPTLGFA